MIILIFSLFWTLTASSERSAQFTLATASLEYMFEPMSMNSTLFINLNKLLYVWWMKASSKSIYVCCYLLTYLDWILWAMTNLCGCLIEAWKSLLVWKFSSNLSAPFLGLLSFVYFLGAIRYHALDNKTNLCRSFLFLYYLRIFWPGQTRDLSRLFSWTVANWKCCGWILL